MAVYVSLFCGLVVRKVDEHELFDVTAEVCYLHNSDYTEEIKRDPYSLSDGK